jgi:hypothetical protein
MPWEKDDVEAQRRIMVLLRRWVLGDYGANPLNEDEERMVNEYLRNLQDEDPDEVERLTAERQATIEHHRRGRQAANRMEERLNEIRRRQRLAAEARRNKEHEAFVDEVDEMYWEATGGKYLRAEQRTLLRRIAELNFNSMMPQTADLWRGRLERLFQEYPDVRQRVMDLPNVKELTARPPLTRQQELALQREKEVRMQDQIWNPFSGEMVKNPLAPEKEFRRRVEVPANDDDAPWRSELTPFEIGFLEDAMGYGDLTFPGANAGNVNMMVDQIIDNDLRRDHPRLYDYLMRLVPGLAELVAQRRTEGTRMTPPVP